jgi:hypothetical protein
MNNGEGGPPRFQMPPTESMFQHSVKQQGDGGQSYIDSTTSEDCEQRPCHFMYLAGPYGQIYDTSSQSPAFGSSAFLSLQQMVNDYAVNRTRIEAGDMTDAGTSPLRYASFVTVFLSTMPFAEYSADGFWGQIKDLFAIFIIVSFMYPVSSMIRQLVTEKETKIKEGMRMMSLDNGALVTSWILHFGSTWWILAVVLTFQSQNLFVYSDPRVVFICE